jgi:uncharacterized coiled-coil protein SlyX/predicted  nucleic acid-binding Zn-ribbon protein
MSRTQTLELLAALVDGLEEIGGAEPGRPLRSADWNALINGVVTLARLVESRERTTTEQLQGDFAPRQHLHTGQADLSWFDPETRATIEGRRVGPEVSNALSEMRRELGGVRTRMDKLEESVEAIRLELYALRDRDDARDKSVSRLDLRFESVLDLEERVSGIDRRFDGVSKSVQDALAFRETLAGVDVRALEERLGSVESLRQNLETASGQVVLIRDFEQRITLLESDAVRSSQLDQELSSRLQDGGFLDETTLATSLLELADQRFQPRFDELAQVDLQLDSRLVTLDQGIVSQTQTLAGLNTRVTSIEPVVASTTGLGSRVDGLTVRINALDVTAAVHDSSLRTLDAMPSRVAQLENGMQNVSGLSVSVDLLSNRISGMEDVVGPLREIEEIVHDHDRRLAQAEELPRRIEELDFRVVELERKRLSSFDQRLVAVESQLDDFTLVSTSVQELDKRQAALDAWRLTTGSRLDKLEGVTRSQATLSDSMLDLGRRTGTLETQVKDLSVQSVTQTQTLGTLTPLVDRVVKLEGTTESLSSRLTLSQRTLTQLETRMTTTESTVGTLANAGFVDAGTLTQLTSRLSTVETRVSKVETTALKPIATSPILRAPGT